MFSDRFWLIPLVQPVNEVLAFKPLQLDRSGVGKAVIPRFADHFSSGIRDLDFARCCEGRDPGGLVDNGPEEITLRLDDFAGMDADAQSDGRSVGLLGRLKDRPRGS